MNYTISAPISNKHYLLSVGGYTFFVDRVEGWSKIRSNLPSVKSITHAFSIFLTSGRELIVIGTEKFCSDEQEILFNHCDNDNDLPETHPVGQSG